MKLRDTALLAVLLTLLCTACSRPTRVLLSIDPEIAAEIADTVKATQLPVDHTYVEPGDTLFDFEIQVVLRDWDRRPGDSAPTALMDREWFAPVVPLWSDVLDSSDLTTDPDIRPLSAISLPNRALPTGGDYPGDDGYPWYRDTVIQVVSADGKLVDSAADEGAVLYEWLSQFSVQVDPPAITWIGGVGDILPARGVEKLLPLGLEEVFGDTLPVLASVDLLLGNLEGAVTTRGTRASKSYTFRFHPRVLNPLAEAGFDYLSLTNNHSFDYGVVGFADTLAHLGAAGLHTSGAGSDLEAASAPSTFVSDDTEVRILSVGAYPRERNGFDGKSKTSATNDAPGVLWKGDAANAAISGISSDETFDILMVHGGEEWSTEPSEEFKNLLRSYVDLGADLILGSHPHVVHGLEAYKGRLIAYSLGNFIFPGMEETRYGEESMIVRLGVFNNAIKYVEIVPVEIEGRRLSIDQGDAILSRVLNETSRLNDADGSAQSN